MEQNIDKQNEFNEIPAAKIIRQNAISLAMVLIIILIITHIFREQLMEYNNWMSVAYFLLVLVTILITQIQVREKSKNGVISYSEAFGVGMKLSLWVAIIFAAFNLLFYLVIFPDASAEILSLAEQSMRDKGMAENEIEMGLKVTKVMVSPLGVFISTLVIYPIMGAISSLLTSAFVQRSHN